MKRAIGLVSLLVLALTWTLQGVPVSQEILPQSDFNLERFMGRWYDVVVGSNCPPFVERKRKNPVIITMDLQHVASEANFTMTAASFRNGSCHQKFRYFGLTDLPGRFCHHVPITGGYGAVYDVYTYVVDTDYDGYAMILHLSTEIPSGHKSIISKLYSRTMNVSSVVVDNFKALAKQHGISDDALIINQKKGECVPTQQVTGSITQICEPK